MALTVTLATAIVSNTSTSATSGSFTPAVGEYLVAIGTGGATSQTAVTPAISDTQAGAWTRPQLANFSTTTGQGGGTATAIWYRPVASATSMTVTVSNTGGTVNASSVEVYRVSSGSGILIGTSNNGDSGGGVTNITPTAFTSTIPSSVMFVGFGEWSGGLTITSSDLTLTAYSNGNQEGGAGYKTLGSVGSKTFNLNGGGGGGAWVWAALEVGETTSITASETSTSIDSASPITVGVFAADGSAGADAPGTSQGKGATETATGIDLGQVNGIPVSAADTSSGVDAVSVLAITISDIQVVQGIDGGTVVVPPVPILDFDFGFILDLPRRVAKGPYRLNLPYTEGWRAEHPFFRRIAVHRGLSLLRIDGVFQLINDPTFEQFAAADRIYLGGYDNWVTDDEAQELGNAGWASYISDFVFVPDAFYGAGQYGASVYGN